MLGSVHRTWAKTEGQTPKYRVAPEGAAKGWYTAAYDAVGNRTGIQEVDGTLATFGYDTVDQLTREQRSGVNAYNTTYLYDASGNRLAQIDSGQVTTYLHNPANELFLVMPAAGQPTTIGYDANGNRTVENTGGALTSYAWDPENRLTNVAYADGSVDTMTYSGDGKRQQRETSAGVTGFLWDRQNVLSELDGAGAIQAAYTGFPGYWGGLVSQRRAGASSFYGFDPAGAVRLLSSAAGAVTDEYLFKAFGDELAAIGSTPNPFRYGGAGGYYRDLASRLQVGARPLDVVAGLWLSRDPIGFSGGDWNLYRYVANNPIALLDPSGMKSKKKHNPPWYLWPLLILLGPAGCAAAPQSPPPPLNPGQLPPDYDVDECCKKYTKPWKTTACEGCIQITDFLLKAYQLGDKAADQMCKSLPEGPLKDFCGKILDKAIDKGKCAACQEYLNTNWVVPRGFEQFCADDKKRDPQEACQNCCDEYHKQFCSTGDVCIRMVQACTRWCIGPGGD